MEITKNDLIAGQEDEMLEHLFISHVFIKDTEQGSEQNLNMS